jgi:hypothetical protein
MAERGALERAESVSRIFAAILIPVIIGFAGLFANQALEHSKSKDDLLKQAIDVVFLSNADKMSGDSKSFESRRAHRSYWLDVYNKFADVKLSNEFIAMMMEHDTLASEKELFWTGHMPSLIANSERAPGVETTNEDELGHGWVAVGRMSSKHYSHVNFDLPPGAIERDGTIKSGTLIHARWSVTMRFNTRNLEDRQGYTGTDRGLLWGGECVKVRDSLIDGRAQTWAFVEIVQCAGITKSAPGVEQHAGSKTASSIRATL